MNLTIEDRWLKFKDQVFPRNTPQEVLTTQKLIFMSGAAQCYELMMSYAHLSEMDHMSSLGSLDKEFNDYASNILQEKMGISPEQFLNYIKSNKGGAN